MRIESVELYNVKSFGQKLTIDFDYDSSIFSFSGRNGSGKSTILKSVYLIQKAYFFKTGSEDDWREIDAEARRFLNAEGSYIGIVLQEGEDRSSLTLYRRAGIVELEEVGSELVERYWNPDNPEGLILYIDASKGFSEETLRFNEINITENTRGDLALEAVRRPEELFSGVYRQLVKDYVHGRLIPSKPDRLLYYRVASRMFSKLIPNIELKNFSGKHKSGEFVLLGKANRDSRKPLYDVREFSSGEKALLSTLSFLCMSKSVSALIIDEPENHFHESLLLEFMSLLHTLAGDGGILGWVNRQENEDGKGGLTKE